MGLELIGPHPFELDAQGRQKTRIGTVFPELNLLCTAAPCVHAAQRLSVLELVTLRRAAQNLPPFSLEEQENVSLNSVDLFFEPNLILIRPDPRRMDLAFAADDLLQGLVSKRRIRYLSVSDYRVREAIKRRGENWRLSTIPKTRDAKRQLIRGSKVAIHGHPIYYYSRLTGTRWLTFQEFERLGALDDSALALHLQEIADYSVLRNRLGRPELDFFAADMGRFGAREGAGVIYKNLSGEQLRAKYRELRETFRSMVHQGFQKDDWESNAWCERMLSQLFLEGNETETEQIMAGLTPEFFLRVEWLPGGRIEEGEFLFDPIFDEGTSHPEDPELQHLCDPRAKGIIFNLVREHGDLEYVNLGCLPESLSLNRPQRLGRRAVYIAEFQSRNEPGAIRRLIRLQKWGVWEHLDEGKDLLQAIRDSDEYTDYFLDRRLGCRQLGMNLTRRVEMRCLTEVYQGTNAQYRGDLIRTTYFEREYLPGIASDKLPLESYHRPGYAEKLAALLGEAAAANMIVGRSFDGSPVFDDGDELIYENPEELPIEIKVGDHSGAFGEYKQPLKAAAAYYARPVNVRDRVVPNPEDFALAYLRGLSEQLLRTQGDYRKRRRAFDNLFKHCKYDPAGSFAYRWERVLQRLEQTNVAEVIEAIRNEIRVLNAERPTGEPERRRNLQGVRA